MLLISRTWTTLGDRTFCATRPGVRNILPTDLRESDLSCGHYRELLKMILFGQLDYSAVQTHLTAL